MEGINLIKFAIKKVALFSVFINIATLITSVYSLQVLDRVLGSGSLHTLFWITTLALIAHSAIKIFGVIRDKILFQSGCFIELSMHEIMLKEALHNERESKIIAAIEHVKNFLQNRAGIANLIDLFWSCIFLLVLFAIHFSNGLIALTGIVVTLIYILKYNKFDLPETSQSNNKSTNFYDNLLNSIYQNKTYYLTSAFTNLIQFTAQAKDMAISNKIAMHAKEQSSNANLMLIQTIVQTLIFANAAILVIENKITSGAMIATSIIFSKTIAPFAMVKTTINLWKSFHAHWPGFKYILQNYQSLPQKKLDLKTTLTVKNLHVKTLDVFKDRAKYSIKDANFEIQGGCFLTVTGASGSGKTTLLKALAGSIKPDFGSVKFDEIPVWDLVEKTDNTVSCLFSDATMANASFSENISRFSPNPDRAQIEHLCKALNVHDFINSLEKDYDTIFDPKSSYTPLSIQKQILLARTFFNLPKMIILENPMDGLDSAIKPVLFDLISHAKSLNSIVILETNNTQVIEKSDKVIVVQNGHTSQLINPSELLSKLQ